mgnify:FL=1
MSLEAQDNPSYSIASFREQLPLHGDANRSDYQFTFDKKLDKFVAIKPSTENPLPLSKEELERALSSAKSVLKKKPPCLFPVGVIAAIISTIGSIIVLAIIGLSREYFRNSPALVAFLILLPIFIGLLSFPLCVMVQSSIQKNHDKKTNIQMQSIMRSLTQNYSSRFLTFAFDHASLIITISHYSFANLQKSEMRITPTPSVYTPPVIIPPVQTPPLPTTLSPPLPTNNALDDSSIQPLTPSTEYSRPQALNIQHLYATKKYDSPDYG